MKVAQLSNLIHETWNDICNDDLAKMNGRITDKLDVLHNNTRHWNERDLRNA